MSALNPAHHTVVVGGDLHKTTELWINELWHNIKQYMLVIEAINHRQDQQIMGPVFPVPVNQAFPWVLPLSNTWTWFNKGDIICVQERFANFDLLTRSASCKEIELTQKKMIIGCQIAEPVFIAVSTPRPRVVVEQVEVARVSTSSLARCRPSQVITYWSAWWILWSPWLANLSYFGQNFDFW